MFRQTFLTHSHITLDMFVFKDKTSEPIFNDKNKSVQLNWAEHSLPLSSLTNFTSRHLQLLPSPCQPGPPCRHGRSACQRHPGGPTLSLQVTHDDVSWCVYHFKSLFTQNHRYCCVYHSNSPNHYVTFFHRFTLPRTRKFSIQDIRPENMLN